MSTVSYLSTPNPSRSQNTWSSLPWVTFLFVLVVFFFASPMWFFGSLVTPADIATLDDSPRYTEVLGRDNWMRIIALTSLGGISILRFLQYEQSRFRINGLLGWLIIFFLSWAALSILWAIDPRYAAKRVVILLLLCFVAFDFASKFSLQEIKALTVFICSVAVLLALIFSISHYYFYPFHSEWRLGGIMHPVALAWHCGILVLFALALAKTATSKKNRAFFIGIIIIALLSLILTRSRVALLACFMACALYIYLATENRHQAILFFLCIIIAGCVLYFTLGSEFASHSQQIITLGRTGEFYTYRTLTGRTPLWEASMILINKNPLVGYGYDSFLSGQNVNFMAEKIGWAANSPHSGFIALLGGLGYIGTVPFVLILIISISISIRLVKRDPDFALIAAVLVWLTINLLTEDQVLSRPFFPVLVWMILVARLGFVREESF